MTAIWIDWNTELMPEDQWPKKHKSVCCLSQTYQQRKIPMFRFLSFRSNSVNNELLTETGQHFIHLESSPTDQALVDLNIWKNWFKFTVELFLALLNQILVLRDHLRFSLSSFELQHTGIILKIIVNWTNKAVRIDEWWKNIMSSPEYVTKRETT